MIGLNETPLSVLAGEPFAFQVAVTGTPAPQLSLSDAPGGMSIDAQTDLVTWNTGAATPGAYSFTVTASNSVAQVSKAFSVGVSAAAPALPAALSWLLPLLGACGVALRSRRRASPDQSLRVS